MSKSKRITQKRNKIRASVFVAALVVALVVAAVMASGLLSGDADNQEFQPAQVVRVVDGDTLIVRTGGVEERLRLIGIDAPESVHPDESRNTEEGVAASNFVKSIVQPGQTVYLQMDISNRDKYDRLLRYVWLEVPDDPWDINEVRTKMLNGILVDKGHADPKRYEPDTAYNNIFDAIR
ncbi:MAG: thermonuclease family protein [Coriobacteriia bacterium]|nr:thermonuclease family protein [Coriobacteriia bacterium]MCL2749469.1 thermonuclease family protein [Coriobacteriia bacterium]